jgi:hypothetical protein
VRYHQYGAFSALAKLHKGLLRSRYLGARGW